jgi:tetratricopeptide (TPR) repeat protein
MKVKKAEIRKGAAAVAPAVKGRPARWPWFAAAAGTLLALFIVYGPSLHGAFQFDDTMLPFTQNVGAPFIEWVRGLRPILMASYWMNARMTGDDPSSYHVVNVLLHWIAGGFIFLIVRRLLEWGGVPQSRRTLLAAFAAGVFLFHPVQTEAVAYIAGRSECLSAMLVFAAFTVYLYRREQAASWATVAVVLALFGAALLSKEHTVAFVGLLLLTDFWWNPGFSFEGIGRNWKLYVPVAVGAAAGVFSFRDLLMHATTAGFGMKDFTWYQYLFTQFRALFVYIFQFVAPFHLTADWDFPISKTLFDHGAIFGLIALAGLAGAAWIYRRRFPLAAYGFFVYLVLMSPTSSILPIKDPVAERRLYFGMLGLLLIVVDFAGRIEIDRKRLATACGVIVAVLAIATYGRAEIWADPVALWRDTVAKSPNNRRAHFQLAYALWTGGKPDQAVAEFQRTAELGPATSDLLMDWGLAYDSLNQPEQAVAKFRQSVMIDPTAEGYVNIAKVHAERAQWSEALDALAAAQKIDANNVNVYTYRGKVYLKTGRVAEAVAEYQHALAIDPNFQEARHDLGLAQQMQRGGR